MAARAPLPSVGIAGWSYPDWNGWVYPRGTKDTLRFVAGYVDMIEINSSFYRPPAAGTVASWVRRTGDLADFFFTAKLHQDITHGQQLDPELVRAFHEGFRPMLEAARLRHLLAQFRYDFDDVPNHREHLARIRDAFGGMTELTLELRHGSWQTPDALEYLAGLDINLAILDYPEASNSFNLALSPVGRHAYMRLHGRNRKTWFDAKAGRDATYDYCYSAPELDGILERAGKQAAMSKSLTLVANNHYRGQEVVNALEIKARLHGGKIKLPPGLADLYEQLKPIQAAGTKNPRQLTLDHLEEH